MDLVTNVPEPFPAASVSQLIPQSSDLGYENPEAVICDSSGEHFREATYYQIAEFDSSGKLVASLFPTPIDISAGLAFDANGSLYATDAADGEVWSISSGVWKVFANTGMDYPAGMVFYGSDLWVANYSGDDLTEYDSSGNLINTIPLGDNDPWGMVLGMGGATIPEPATWALVGSGFGRAGRPEGPQQTNLKAFLSGRAGGKEGEEGNGNPIFYSKAPSAFDAADRGQTVRRTGDAGSVALAHPAGVAA